MICLHARGTTCAEHCGRCANPPCQLLAAASHFLCASQEARPARIAPTYGRLLLAKPGSEAATLPCAVTLCIAGRGRGSPGGHS